MKLECEGDISIGRRTSLVFGVCSDRKVDVDIHKVKPIYCILIIVLLKINKILIESFYKVLRLIGTFLSIH